MQRFHLRRLLGDAGSFRVPGLFAAGLILAGLAASCAPAETIVWRTRQSKPERQEFPAPNFRMTVTTWPSADQPEVAVQVECMKFWVERSTKSRQKFKKSDDGKYEAIPGTTQQKHMSRITGETGWTPKEGFEVVFRPNLGTRGEVRIPTNAEGRASFDVSPFAEEWVEGRELVVEVVARLKTLTDPQAWETVKNKAPSQLKELVIEEKDVLETVRVGTRTLQSIFERGSP